MNRKLKIRRATLDDLPSLRAIWTSMKLPAAELESRLKEFQVAENAEGEILGAVAIQFSGQHAIFYAEGFSDFSVADAARELFFEKIQTLAALHGVFRVWTTENSPFWTRGGFLPASEEILKRLPEQWKSAGENWFTLQLKDEDAVAAALKNKFADFMISEKAQTERVREKAKMLKTAIIIAGFSVFFLCLAAALWLLRRNPLGQ